MSRCGRACGRPTRQTWPPFGPTEPNEPRFDREGPPRGAGAGPRLLGGDEPPARHRSPRDRKTLLVQETCPKFAGWAAPCPMARRLWKSGGHPPRKSEGVPPNPPKLQRFWHLGRSRISLSYMGFFGPVIVGTGLARRKPGLSLRVGREMPLTEKSEVQFTGHRERCPFTLRGSE
jgi:hypothetical protein